jgi:hypothetical protein
MTSRILVSLECASMIRPRQRSEIKRVHRAFFDVNAFMFASVGRYRVK